MADPLRFKSDRSHHQIVIEEEEMETFTDAQDGNPAIYSESMKKDRAAWAEEIKINREKLLRYAALSEKNTNLPEKEGKPKAGKDSLGGNSMQGTKLRYAPSAKTLKPIRHRITPAETRLKTESDKENHLKPLLPRVNSKKSQSR
jgi:hypothetical protein